jgi:hypothetical protein
VRQLSPLSFSDGTGTGGRLTVVKELIMSFRFYTNMISQASRNFAAGLFITGLLLIGFGFLVYILRDLFAVLASIVFFIVGLGCGTTAVKIFWAQRKFDKMNSDDGTADYRRNVRIHGEEYYDRDM